jgi:hypothetical protein
MSTDTIVPPEAHQAEAVDTPTPVQSAPHLGRRLGRFPVGFLVALGLLAAFGAGLALRPAPPAPAPAAVPVPYAPALRTGTAEDQRRVQVETAAEFFIRTWLRSAPEADRLAALTPLMAPGTATRPAARTDLPAATLCCAPEVVKVDDKGALYATRLADGSPITIRGIFTSEGMFLVSDVQG